MGVQGLKTVIASCEAVTTEQDWTHIDKIAQVLEDPEHHAKQIEEDIIFNGATITKDIGEALVSYRAGEYEKFGEKLGETFYVAAEGEKLFLY